jgi:outer membrane protein
VPQGRSAGDVTGEPVSVTATPDLDDRDFALLAGVEYSGWRDDDNWQLQVLRDVTGVHEGYELRAAWQRAFAAGADSWLATVGVAYKSSRLVDYYYGVDPHEAGPGREAYRADGATTAFARLGWRRALGERWQLRADLQYDHLGSEISDSPLVKQSYSVAGFVGVHYRIW